MKINKGWFKKGIQNNPNGGFPKGHKLFTGKKHGNWKGQEASYSSKHKWVYTWWGRATKCEICKNDNAKRYEWANLDGLYKREKKTWKQMCRSCHIRYDWTPQRREQAIKNLNWYGKTINK